MEEHVGHSIHEVVPHLVDQLIPMLQNVLDTAEPVLDYEVRGPTLKHPGEERVFLGTHFPLKSEAGEVLYVHTIVRDITDQRRAEAGLKESHDRLEERVKARTEELVLLGEKFKAEAAERIRAQEEASQRRAELAHLARVRSTGELAASISHELNQPLAAVLTNAQAALRLLEKKKPDLEELREILVDIVADDKRAGHVIRRLRALFLKGPVAQEDVQLEELVSGVVPLVRGGAQGANVRINVSSSPNLPPVEVDPVQVQQVVMNLLANGIDAIQRLDADGGDIEVEISRAGAKGVLVTVSDNGPGLPAKEIGDVFKPFVTTKPGGMGMGLAICKSILDAHGGTISVENNVSGGCRFSFTLPRKQPVLNQAATS
jgi:C4-dicarboxylate-specific signal transduction histidine kinase